MAGNILYIPYTILMIAALIILGSAIWVKKGKGMFAGILLISLPIFTLVQFYYWSLSFNDYVKSYLFPSKNFTCQSYGGEALSLSIELPRRTVFHGKADACSPFYTTYINHEEFISFYEKQLHSLKGKGIIKNFRYVDGVQGDGEAEKGFVMELPSGSLIDIDFEARKDLERNSLSIHYHDHADEGRPASSWLIRLPAGSARIINSFIGHDSLEIAYCFLLHANH